MKTIRESEQEGLTVVEVLAIIVILFVLVGMFYSALIGTGHPNRSLATRAMIASIQAACEAFNADWGFYPPDEIYGDWEMPEGAGSAMLATFRPDPAFKVQGAAGRILRDPQNGTTKGLVFLLGSSFTIGGKIYGPYMVFRRSRLSPPASTDPAPRHFKPTASVAVDVPKEQERYAVSILTDWFGNAFVYDSHFPESKRLLIEFNDVHNTKSFDIYSFGRICKKGADGLVTDEDPKRHPGANEDDINNWR
jgi:hypothetical protein